MSEDNNDDWNGNVNLNWPTVFLICFAITVLCYGDKIIDAITR